MSEDLSPDLEQYQNRSPEQREVDTREEKEVPEWEVITHPSERMMIVNDIAHTLQKIQAGQYDTLVWLDKSARPLDTVLRSAAHELWGRDDFQSRFLAVGSLSKIREHKESDLPEDIVQQVRDLYRPDPGKQGWGKVLVLDELMNTGRSAHSTARLFNEAFRDHEKYGIKGVDYDDVLSQYPTWYNRPELVGVKEDIDSVKEGISGRLKEEDKRWIGELEDAEYQKFKKQLSTAGRKVTSRRYKGKDARAVEFREELQRLGEMTACYYLNLVDGGRLRNVRRFAEKWLQYGYREDCRARLPSGTSLLEAFPELAEELDLPVGLAQWKAQEGGYFFVSDESLEGLLESLKNKSPMEKTQLLGKLQILAEEGIIKPERTDARIPPGYYDPESPSWDQAAAELEKSLLEM